MRMLVYGAAALGQLMRRHVELCGHEFEGFIDDAATDPDVLGGYDEVRARLPPAADRGIIVAVVSSDMRMRRSIGSRLLEDGYALPTMTHPAAWVHPDAELGAGVLIGPGATVDGGARLATLSILWPGAIVSHDAELAENTWLSPGAIVCGFARIGRDTFIGAGAVVPDTAVVPADSFVRAGSVTPRKVP